MLGGVSASFARRYDVNPLVARLLTITGILVLTPFAYVGAWILMRKDGTPRRPPRFPPDLVRVSAAGSSPAAVHPS